MRLPSPRQMNWNCAPVRPLDPYRVGFGKIVLGNKTSNSCSLFHFTVLDSLAEEPSNCSPICLAHLRSTFTVSAWKTLIHQHSFGIVYRDCRVPTSLIFCGGLWQTILGLAGITVFVACGMISSLPLARIL